MQPVSTANAFSIQDILVVAAIFLILFGGKKIGDLGKGLGEGIRSFKDAIKEPSTDPKPETKEPDRIEGRK
jgi:sec-independent protein translocase protein TatA